MSVVILTNDDDWNDPNMIAKIKQHLFDHPEGKVFFCFSIGGSGVPESLIYEMAANNILTKWEEGQEDLDLFEGFIKMPGPNSTHVRLELSLSEKEQRRLASEEEFLRSEKRADDRWIDPDYAIGPFKPFRFIRRHDAAGLIIILSVLVVLLALDVL